jgi:chemotaxis protein histidine kinase CheA
LDKKVRFVEEEIDPEIITKGPKRLIKEVLTQLVRNSVVHGIEAPGERLAKGKNETGTISLSMKLSDRNIHIKLADDGKGLDFEKIREKAEQLNLISKDAPENRDLLTEAIFSPGFSTVDSTSVHGGRGIGLNLVRDRIAEARGAVTLQSEFGKGTVFNIVIPAENSEL